jgi:hypothetical protein
MDTPVLLIIFKRPELTAKALAAIAQARPKVLLIAADGPRNAPEKALCDATRRTLERIDWPCELRTDFSDVNLGCGIRVHSAIDWALAQFEEVIILEDDCLPHPSFFHFCETLLARFRDDSRVMHISGNNFQPTGTIAAGYYFSKFAHAWGWATWRRAWRHFDWHMRDWPAAKAAGLLDNWCDTAWEKRFWQTTFDAMHEGAPDVWDYQWNFAMWAQHALAILPRVNLVSNHGSGPDATHTQGSSAFLELPAFDIGDIIHPPLVIRDRAADLHTFEHNYGGAAMRREAEPLHRLRGLLRPVLRPFRALKRLVTSR